MSLSFAHRALISRASVHLLQCGYCDAGLPMECACPEGDPRRVIQELVQAVEDLSEGHAITATPSAMERIKALEYENKNMRGELEILYVANAEGVSQRATPPACIYVSSDSGYLWLECFAKDLDAAHGAPVHQVDAGDTWSDLVSRVTAHRCGVTS